MTGQGTIIEEMYDSNIHALRDKLKDLILETRGMSGEFRKESIRHDLQEWHREKFVTHEDFTQWKLAFDGDICYLVVAPYNVDKAFTKICLHLNCGQEVGRPSKFITENLPKAITAARTIMGWAFNRDDPITTTEIRQNTEAFVCTLCIDKSFCTREPMPHCVMELCGINKEETP